MSLICMIQLIDIFKAYGADGWAEKYEAELVESQALFQQVSVKHKQANRQKRPRKILTL